MNVCVMLACKQTFMSMDAVMIETAIREQMDCIVTRNLSDYTRSPMPVYSPEDFLKYLQKVDA